MTAPAKSRGRRTPAPGRRARATSTVDETPDTTETTTSTRASRGRTSAAERAYARRAQRADLLQRDQQRNRPDADGGTGKEAPRKLKLRWPRSRASFVLMMMGMLAVGVACTLWLTTQAIADSYRLEQLRTTNAGLAEAKERLQREVAKAESPASLAPKAREQGMVPGGDPAHIVVGPDGQSTVVGEPKKAEADAPPATSIAAAPPPAEGTQNGVIEGDQPAIPQEDAAPPAQGGQ